MSVLLRSYTFKTFQNIYESQTPPPLTILKIIISMHVDFIQCLTYAPVIFLQTFAILTILQQFQNNKKVTNIVLKIKCIDLFLRRCLCYQLQSIEQNMYVLL